MSHPSILEVENKRAVLVGINDYVDSSIQDLQFSISDVKAIYDTLAQSSRGGFDEDNIKLLTDDSEDVAKPYRSNIMSSLTALSETASGSDMILFFFSGHGIEQDGENYLLPIDSRINVLNQTAIPIKWIIETLKESDARAKVLVLDACHAGALIGKSESGIMTKSLSDLIFPPPEGFAVLSSCKLNESSHECSDKEHSIFTYYLNEGLLGEADYDSDGLITVSDASRYVAEKVKNWAFKSGKQQNPTLKYEVSGDIILTKVPNVVKKPYVSKKKNCRDYIERVFLRSSGYLDVPRMCAVLLNFYKPDEIEKQVGYYYGSYSFPDGTINRNGIIFNYNSNNWELVDKMVKKLGYEFFWEELEYKLQARFLVQKLVDLCNDSNMNIDRFDADEDFRMEITANGWGREGNPAIVSVENLEDNGAKLTIQQTIYEAGESKLVLKDDFYDQLNPENIINFLKPALIKVPNEEKND